MKPPVNLGSTTSEQSLSKRVNAIIEIFQINLQSFGELDPKLVIAINEK